jgi:NhaA family Na+:H+ antiporter
MREPEHQAAVQHSSAWPKTFKPPLLRFEHALDEPVAFDIMPLYALANAGVSLGPSNIDASRDTAVTFGVVLGLVVGKPGGITLFARLAMRLRVATQTQGVDWRLISGTGSLGGIGFTIALFISSLALIDEPALLVAAKLG